MQKALFTTRWVSVAGVGLIRREFLRVIWHERDYSSAPIGFGILGVFRIVIHKSVAPRHAPTVAQAIRVRNS